MSVKSIFITLIGTITAIIAGCLCIELFNVNVASMEIRQNARIAAKQACELFTQETWKQYKGNDGAINIESFSNDAESGASITGNFYMNNNGVKLDAPAEIWKQIYQSQSFVDFINMAKGTNTGEFVKSNISTSAKLKDYESISIFSKLADTSSTGITEPGEAPEWDASDTDKFNYYEAQMTYTYWSEMYTPANVGIPYMDKATVNRMYRYNLAKILASGDSDNLHKDANGVYVRYKGFKCYLLQSGTTDNSIGTVHDHTAAMSQFQYTVYDTQVNNDMKTLQNYTGLGATAIGSGTALATAAAGKNFTLSGHTFKDNQLITTVGLQYSVPMTYEGVTPLAKIYNYVAKNRVLGYNNSTLPTDAMTNTSYTTESKTLKAGGMQDSDNRSNWHTGSGKLVYTLVR